MADLEGPMPQIRLSGGMVIRFTARDPSANGDVGGVEVRQIHVYGKELDGGGGNEVDMTPHWLPVVGAGD